MWCYCEDKLAAADAAGNVTIYKTADAKPAFSLNGHVGAIVAAIYIPNGSQIEAIGRVAWTRRTLSSGQPHPEAGVGVEFLGGAADQLAALDDYLSRAGAEPAEEKDN